MPNEMDLSIKNDQKSTNAFKSLETIEKLKSSAWGQSLPKASSSSSAHNQIELDQKISELIIQESKKKKDLWESIGIAAYSADKNLYSDKLNKSDGPTVKTNKRFLKSVIRDVNDHNRALIASNSTSSNEKRWASDKYRDDEDSSLRFRSRDHNDRYYYDADDDKSRNRSKSVKNSSSSNNRKSKDNYESRKHSDNVDYTRSKSTHENTSKIANQINIEKDSVSSSLPPETSRSKMDKYFSSDYDPRLDINLDEITDPSTKLINQENSIDDWNVLLDQLKLKKEEKRKEKEAKSILKSERRQRKEERRERRRKRREREKGREREKEKRVKKKRARNSDSDSDSDSDLSDKQRKRRREKEESRRCSKKIQSDDDEDQKNGRSTKRNHKRKKDDSTDSELDDYEDHRRGSSTRRRRSRRSKKSSSDGSSSDDSIDQNLYNKSTHAQRSGRNQLGLMDIEGYAKSGQIREWDLGKQNPT